MTDSDLQLCRLSQHYLTVRSMQNGIYTDGLIFTPLCRFQGFVLELKIDRGSLLEGIKGSHEQMFWLDISRSFIWSFCFVLFLFLFLAILIKPKQFRRTLCRNSFLTSYIKSLSATIRHVVTCVDSRPWRHMLVELVVCSSSGPRGFSPGTPFFSSPQNPTFPNSSSIWNARTCLNEYPWALWCSGKPITFYIAILVKGEHKKTKQM